MLRTHSKSLLLLPLLGSLACEGSIFSPSPGGDGDGPEPGVGEALELPLARVWRLTPLQYERAFVAAFGSTHVAAEDFTADAVRDGFDDLAEQNHVDIAWAELVQRNAAERAAELVPERMSAGCLAEDSIERSCIEAFVDEYGRRAFRRPVDAETRSSLADLFEALVAEGNSSEDALRAVFEAIAQSPFFTYRVETGSVASEGVRELDSYAIASQLSFMLTDAPPDAELLAAAEADTLRDREVVLEHARRLLETPEALQKLSKFFDQYLGIGHLRREVVPKDEEVYPNYSEEIQAAMVAETDRFVTALATREESSLFDIFTAPYTFVDDGLRAFYGWEGSADPGEPFTIPGGERAGIFMHGSVLAAHSASIKTDVLHRGLYIYERLLCNQIAPPDGLDIIELADLLEPPDPESTERQRLEYLKENHEQCGNCHSNFVSLGLALETFDASGVFRETQFDRPLDPSGELKLRKEEAGAFADAPDLFGLIANSRQGQACFAQNWATFAFGSEVEVSIDAKLVDAFQEHQLRLRELLLLVTQEDAFYLRREEPSL